MIFTTKNNEIAILGNTITNVKEKWKDFKKEIVESNGKLFGENGAFASLFSGKKLNLTTEVLSQFEEFKEKFNSSFLSAEALAEQMENVDERIVTYAKTCKNGELTTEGFKASVEGMTLSTKAASVAMKALSIAGNMLVMWAISEVVSGLYELSQVSKEVAERAQELGNSFRSTESDIDSYKEKITELYSTINNNGSSVEQVTNARKELMSVQDELIDKFGDEKGAIDLITQAVKGQTEALDKLTEKQWQATKNQFNQSGFWEGFANWREDYDDNIDRMIDEVENAWSNLDFSSTDYMKYPDLVEKLEKSGWQYDFNSTKFIKGGNARELYEEILEIQTLVGEDVPNNFLKSLTEEANKFYDTIEKYGDMWDSYILQEKIFPDDDLANSWKDVNDAYAKYQNAITSGDNAAIENSISGFANAINKVLNDTNVDDSVKDFFESMYPSLYREMEKWEFKVNILPKYDIGSLQGLRQSNILESLQTEGIQQGESTFNSILQTATDYGIVVGENSDKVEQLLDLLVEWGILQEEIQDSMSDIASSSTSFSDIFSLKDSENTVTNLGKISESIDTIQNAYKTLNDAIDEYNQSGSFSIDTIQSVISLGDDWLDYLVDEEGHLRLDKESLERLTQSRLNDMRVQTINNLIDNVSKIQTDADANEYLTSTNYALAESYEEVAQASLKSAQAKLQDAVAAGTLSQSNMDKIMSKTQTDINKINKLFKNVNISTPSISGSSSNRSSGSSSDPLKEAFEKEYSTLKHNLEMEYITEKQYYDSLDALNKKYFAGKSAYLDEYRKYEEEVYKGLKSYYKDYVESNMDLLAKQLDAGVINYRHYSSTVKSLLENMYSDGKISAENYFSYMQQMLEKQLDIYDRVLKAVTDRFDEEIDYYNDLIDSVEKQNDALESQKETMENAAQAVVDYYQSLIDKQQERIDGIEAENDKINEQISNYDKILAAIDRVYETEQNTLKEQQDSIQDKIDALNDENAALDLQYRKEQALYELQKSLEQRTKKVYIEGQGFVYKQDTEAIRENQKNLQDIENEELIANLEKEKDALQEAIDKLQEYRDLWADISNAWDELQQDQLLKEMYGENAASIILQNRIEDIEDFKNKYLYANQQINDNTELIESIQEKIDQYEKEQEAWKTLTDVIQKNINEQAAAQQFGADWEKQINEGRLVSFEIFKEAYLAIDAQINDNTALINSYNEKIAYYESLKEQWSSIADAYEKSMNEQYAAMILGQNWERDILSGRIDTMNSFKSQYISIQQQIADAAWQSANEQIRAAQEAQKAAEGVMSAAASIANSINSLPSIPNYDNSKPAIGGGGHYDQNMISKYHSGIEEGIVGEGKSKRSDFKLVQKIATDEVPAILKKGEVVLTEKQISILADFARNMLKPNVDVSIPNVHIPTSNVISNIQKPDYTMQSMLVKNSTQPVAINIGDIKLQGVQSPDSLASAIVREFPNKMLQAMNKRHL